MAYDKKYPEIDDFIIDFDKGQEDRIEEGLNDVKGIFKIIRITLPNATGWENGASHDVPNDMIPFIVVQAIAKNQNGALMEVGSSVRPNNQQTKLYAELSGSQDWATNKEATVLIMKV